MHIVIHIILNIIMSVITQMVVHIVRSLVMHIPITCISISYAHACIKHSGAAAVHPSQGLQVSALLV